MNSVTGTVQEGVSHFSERMKKYPNVFKVATGDDLYPGTINVKVDRQIPIKEDFRILGSDIGEPEQDLLFESCQINGVAAYRIRPYHLATGLGGHGDDILEISSSEEIEGISLGIKVEITFFRDID